MSDDRADRTAADLRRYEHRMRAQLGNIVTVHTDSLANIPSLDGLVVNEREQVERELGGDEAGRVGSD